MAAGYRGSLLLQTLDNKRILVKEPHYRYWLTIGAVGILRFRFASKWRVLSGRGN